MESIVNATDGSLARYRYDGVALTLSDAGTKEGDKKIEQMIDFDASFRRKVQ
jgi:hypothetical protein